MLEMILNLSDSECQLKHLLSKIFLCHLEEEVKLNAVLRGLALHQLKANEICEAAKAIKMHSINCMVSSSLKKIEIGLFIK